MNIKISIPKAPPAPIIPAGIPAHAAIIWEKYPRIGEKISLMWGYVELQNYLSDIICDKRGGRQGFPAPVMEALLEIYKRHSKVVPDDKPGHI